jgi:hypothetical protein
MNYISEIEDILMNKENIIQIEYQKTENGDQIIFTPKNHQAVVLILVHILPFFLLFFYIKDGLKSEQILYFLGILIFQYLIAYKYFEKLNKVTIDFKIKELKIENNSMLKKIYDKKSINFKDINCIEAKYSNKQQDKFILKTTKEVEHYMFAGSTIMFKGREYTKKVANNLTCLIKLHQI